MARFSFGLSLVLFVSSCAIAQEPPQSDPQALAFTAQSIAAMTGGASITDATLSGDAGWIAGCDNESGPITLVAKGTGQSRLDLNISGKVRTEIRNDTAGYPQGASIVEGSEQAWPVHNCWSDASWFFLPLSVLASTADSTVIVHYLGQENRNGMSVQHLQFFRHISGNDPAVVALTEKLSTIDVYLESSTFVPVATSFAIHPDSDALVNITADISYSDYELFNQILVPTRIQRSISNSLTMDITVTGVVFNSGPQDSLFVIQ